MKKKQVNKIKQLVAIGFLVLVLILFIGGNLGWQNVGNAISKVIIDKSEFKDVDLDREAKQEVPSQPDDPLDSREFRKNLLKNQRPRSKTFRWILLAKHERRKFQLVMEI